MSRCDFADILAFTADEGADVINEIEPAEEAENEYRQASQRALSFIFCIVEYLSGYENPKQLESRFWAIASALEHPCCGDLNDSQLADMLGQTRANLSKHVLDFERRNGLTAGLSRRSAAARTSYAHAHGRGTKTTLLARGAMLKHLAVALGLLEKLVEATPLAWVSQFEGND